jgi:hypothetical protein
MRALFVRRLGARSVEEAVVRDLSDDGACIATELALPPGAQIYIGLFLRGSGGTPVVARAAIAWAKHDREGAIHIAGLAFIHAGAAQGKAIDALRDYLALRRAELALAED